MRLVSPATKDIREFRLLTKHDEGALDIVRWQVMHYTNPFLNDVLVQLIRTVE